MPAATGFTYITASHIYGSLSGELLASGQIQFTAISTSTRSPISFEVNGSGQMVNKPFSFPIVNGVIVAGSDSITPQLPDVSLTNPVNIGYAVQIIDPLTGNNILGPGYVIQPTGATFNFDAYTPALGAQVTIQTGPAGADGVNGGAGQYSVDVSFTGVQTQTITHNLGVLNPTVAYDVTLGANSIRVTSLDSNRVSVTSNRGTTAGKLLFVGGTYNFPAPVVITEPVTGLGPLIAAASGYPAPTAQWQSSSDSGVTWTTVSGATSNSLAATGSYSLLYRCVYTNVGGTAYTTSAHFSGDILTGLANYWAMNEGSGIYLADAVAGQTIILTSGATWSDGRVNFNGTSTGATASAWVPSQFTDSSQPFTLAFYMTPTTVASFQPLVGSAVEGYSSGVLAYFASAKPGLIIRDTGGNELNVGTAAAPVSAGVRMHIGLTYDGSRHASGVNVFVNGILQTPSVNSDALTTASIASDHGYAFTVGGEGSYSPADFPGSIDHVRFYSVVKSQADIAAMAAGDA